MKYGAFTRLMVATLLGVLATPLGLAGQNEQAAQDSTGNVEHEHFRVRSTTFEDGTELPLSMINNIQTNDVNACTPNGNAGGNQSPQLSWTPGKHGTKSYAVIMYDVTAAFTHWGMYNISPQTTSLPENAGWLEARTAFKSSTTSSREPNTMVHARQQHSPRFNITT